VNWVDLVVVGLAVLAAVSGARQGVITALPAFIGVLLGGIAGIKVAPLVVRHIEATPTKAGFSVAIFILLVALGETLGVWIGRTLRQKVSPDRVAPWDATLGAVVQGAVVFVLAWLVGAALVNVPVLARPVNQSLVLGKVNDLMPATAHQIPSELRKLLDDTGFPAALGPFAETPAKEVAPPDPALQSSEVVQRVAPSVLKVRARASSCERALEGTGFVVAPQRVMTNAHVVAGTDEVSVEVGDQQLRGQVVLYDPDTDVAVLSVPALRAAPLALAGVAASSGQDGIVLGYPLDGPYTASAARVRDRIQLNGPDIYDTHQVSREVFTLRAVVRSGNSGGPLVDTAGDVVGVIFGAAVDNSETGFALTAREVADEVAAAPGLSQQVGTGRCAG